MHLSHEAGPPPVPVRAVAVLSVHASPLAELGTGDNGGMNLTIRRLCAELGRRGLPTDVFVRREDPFEPTERLIAPGSRMLLVDAGPPRRLPKAEVLRHVPAFTAAVAAHAIEERRRYRLIHSHYWLSGWVATRLARSWQVPWVHSSHTLARLKASAGLALDGERAAVEDILSRTADRLVAASTAEARALADLCGADPDHVCVIRPGVDADLLALTPPAGVARRLLPPGRRAILFAGRLERLKGLELLIDAFVQVARGTGHDDVDLICAGGDSDDGRLAAAHPGGERGRLEARVAELGVAGRVHFVGALPPDELHALMAAATVVAVPSLTETFGLVALEAQALGTPVVASAVGGLLDAVADGVSGRLVEGRDANAFAGALTELLDDPGTRRRLSLGARAHASALTWGHSADRLLHLYDCVERPAPAPVLEACGCL